MNKSRLEAFSDGVFAIIITIMVLELKIPENSDWLSVKPLVPVFICYVLSFIFIAIYWGNHHHLMHTLKRINASVMWSNMLLLFWLSLVPFATGWMGKTNFDRVTVAIYGSLLLICGVSYTLLSRAIRSASKEETNLTRAIAKSNIKGVVSTVLYALSVPLALFVNPVFSAALFAAVAVMWLVPSKAIEQALEQE
jgi:uncharacterized membrane protein